MITIKKIIIENFQSHKYSVMEFTNGLNAIIGPTDSGKTAIFRALKWALYNEPQGDYFMREGEKSVSVTIEFNDGFILKRYRKKGKNGYNLTYPNGEELNLEGFGTKVPLEVLEGTKMRKIALTPSEDRSLNMAEQLDPPFLLSETPSLKAAAIGKLVDADIIDYALSNTNTDLKSKKRDLADKINKEENLVEELKEYDYLDELKSTIKKLETIQSKKQKLSQKLSTLENLLRIYEPLKTEKELAEYTLKKLQVTDQIQDKFNVIENRILKLNNLDRLCSLINYNIKREDYSKVILNNLKEINTLEDKINQVNYKSSFLKNLEVTEKNYTNVLNRQKYILNIYQRFKDLDNAYLNQEKLVNKIEAFNLLNKQNKQLIEARRRINIGNKYMDKFNTMDEAKVSTEKCENKLYRLRTLENIKNRYVKLASSMKYQNDKIQNYSKEIENFTNKYKNLMEELKICPTCFKPIEDGEDIIKHLSDEV